MIIKMMEMQVRDDKEVTLCFLGEDIVEKDEHFLVEMESASI